MIGEAEYIHKTEENEVEEVELDETNRFEQAGNHFESAESRALINGENTSSDEQGSRGVVDSTKDDDDLKGHEHEMLSTIEEDGEPILEPHENDILSGRGASVNAHRGNIQFRALCFSRKPEFEAGNHAAKRRIATEIVRVTKALPGRFLKRKNDKGPWFEVSAEKAILKACQVMRDFQRPDRLILREMASTSGARKRQRTSESTPGVNAPIPTVPLSPIVENPFGVHDHDVLSGRGAFVNGHVGNERFRQLAIERKPRFDEGNYSEKRALATEIVGIIRSLDPPGRFLKRASGSSRCASSHSNAESWSSLSRGLDGEWEVLSDDKAIHKACQVMRDLNRPDRALDKKVNARKSKAAGHVGSKVEDQEEIQKENTGDVLALVQNNNALDQGLLLENKPVNNLSASNPSAESNVHLDEESHMEMMQV